VTSYLRSIRTESDFQSVTHFYSTSKLSMSSFVGLVLDVSRWR